MINLDLKEVSEMIFQYMQEKHIDLLTAYEEVCIVLKERCCFDYETIKQYLFHNDISSCIKENREKL